MVVLKDGVDLSRMEPMVDQLLADLREHVSGLQHGVNEANSILAQSEGVSEKISLMKEYKDDLTCMNFCCQDRGNIGGGQFAQRENRQILALEEENRQLMLTLEEYQRALTLIMEKHREMVMNYEKNNELLKLVKQKNVPYSDLCLERRLFEISGEADLAMNDIGRKRTADAEKMATVCAENYYLRCALAARRAAADAGEGFNVNPQNHDGGSDHDLTPNADSPTSASTSASVNFLGSGKPNNLVSGPLQSEKQPGKNDDGPSKIIQGGKR